MSQFVEVKGLQSIVKNVIDILEGQTLQRWEGMEIRRSAQMQQQAQAAARTAAAASRHRNTSNKKSSNKQQNQEQHKQHKQQPRKSEGQEVWVPKVWEGTSSRGISVARLFFWMQAKVAIIGH